MIIERYDPTIGHGGDYAEMVKCSYGDYVRIEDYEVVMYELETLKDKIYDLYKGI